MIEVCALERVFPEQVFFIFVFSVVFIIMAILQRNPNKSFEGYRKKRKFLVVIMRVFSFKYVIKICKILREVLIYNISKFLEFFKYSLLRFASTRELKILWVFIGLNGVESNS